MLSTLRTPFRDELSGYLNVFENNWRWTTTRFLFNQSDNKLLYPRVFAFHSMGEIK
jgi:hypothetical protein